MLQGMKLGADRYNRESPFLYKQFNIFYFYNSWLLYRKNALARTFDAFMDGLDRRPFLPRYILVVLDMDFITMIADELKGKSGLTAQLQRVVDWLALHMEREIEARIEYLSKKRPGAVDDHETQIIWVEMFERPGALENQDHNKFNKCINEMAVRRKNTHILRIETLQKNANHFEVTSCLNP